MQENGRGGRRADLCIFDRCLAPEGLFQATLREAKDVGRLRDALLYMEDAPLCRRLRRSRLPSLKG